MAQIRIEWVPIQVMNLGLLGLDHLQLVYEPNEVDGPAGQANWFVMEGTRDIDPSSGSLQPTLGVEGANGFTTLAQANLIDDPSTPPGVRVPTPEELENTIGTPQSRGSLPLPFSDAFGTWNLMAVYAGEIEAQNLPYVGAAFHLQAWQPSTPPPSLHR